MLEVLVISLVVVFVAVQMFAVAMVVLFLWDHINSK